MAVAAAVACTASEINLNVNANGKTEATIDCCCDFIKIFAFIFHFRLNCYSTIIFHLENGCYGVRCAVATLVQVEAKTTTNKDKAGGEEEEEAKTFHISPSYETKTNKQNCLD